MARDIKPKQLPTARTAVAEGFRVLLSNFTPILWMGIKASGFSILVMALIGATAIGSLHLFGIIDINSLSSLNAEHFAALGPSIALELLGAMYLLNVIFLWLGAPMMIALSEAIMSGERLKSYYLARLFSERSTRLALIVSIGVLVGLIFQAAQQVMMMQATPALLIGSIIAAIVGFVAQIYVSLRIYYAIPAIAIDKKFRSLADYWNLSERRGWLLLRTILLSFLYIIGIMIVAGLVGLLGYFLWTSVPIIGAIITVLLGIGIACFMIVMTGLFFAPIICLYKRVEGK